MTIGLSNELFYQRNNMDIFLSGIDEIQYQFFYAKWTRYRRKKGWFTWFMAFDLSMAFLLHFFIPWQKGHNVVIFTDSASDQTGILGTYLIYLAL